MPSEANISGYNTNTYTYERLATKQLRINLYDIVYRQIHDIRNA